MGVPNDDTPIAPGNGLKSEKKWKKNVGEKWKKWCEKIVLSAKNFFFLMIWETSDPIINPFQTICERFRPLLAHLKFWPRRLTFDGLEKLDFWL